MLQQLYNSGMMQIEEVVSVEISKKIYLLRTENNLTQAELGKIAGASDKAVSAWENGIRSPKIQFTRPICEHFGIDLNIFIDESNDIYKSNLPSNVIPITSMRQAPLLGRIACGEPILAEENIEDYVDLPKHITADFALECRGDSMIGAGIQDGDVVYIRQQPEVENGQIAAVLVGDEEATLKRFYFDGTTVQLVAENPKFAPMVFTGEDINKVRVIGRAVAFTHSLI